MKLYVVQATRWLGPGTPLMGIVREENEQKAVEAFMDPSISPFGPVSSLTSYWFSLKVPDPKKDFVAKIIGTEDRWPDHFSEDLRSPLINVGPTLSKEEHLCRSFMEDRIIIRTFNSGGLIAATLFNLKLFLSKFLRNAADALDNHRSILEVDNE